MDQRGASPHENRSEGNQTRHGNTARDTPTVPEAPILVKAPSSALISDLGSRLSENGVAIQSSSSPSLATPRTPSIPRVALPSIAPLDPDPALLQLHEQYWEKFSAAEQRRLDLIDELRSLQVRIRLPVIVSAQEDTSPAPPFEPRMSVEQVLTVYQELISSSKKGCFAVRKELYTLNLQHY